MAHRDKRIDIYILDSAAFAQEILHKLRDLVHIVCPDVQETMKWSFPHFTYNDRILCYMAAFKHHCAFGFRDGVSLSDPAGVLQVSDRNAMGHLGKIKSVADIPDDEILIDLIAQAMILNEQKPEKKTETKRKPAAALEMPSEFRNALKKNAEAASVFSNLSVSKKNDYILWVTEAKSEATREKRINTSIEWLNEGKSRNWKYEKR